MLNFKSSIDNMFWHKKQSANWILLFFGLIALGIVISVAILIILISQKANKISQQKVFLPTIEETLKMQKLTENYQKSIIELVDNLTQNSTSTPVKDFFQKTEDIFLNIRVPFDYRDKHLEVFLKIEKIKEQSEIGDLDKTKQEVINLIAGLVK